MGRGPSISDEARAEVARRRRLYLQNAPKRVCQELGISKSAYARICRETINGASASDKVWK